MPSYHQQRRSLRLLLYTHTGVQKPYLSQTQTRYLYSILRQYVALTKCLLSDVGLVSNNLYSRALSNAKDCLVGVLLLLLLNSLGRVSIALWPCFAGGWDSYSTCGTPLGVGGLFIHQSTDNACSQFKDLPIQDCSPWKSSRLQTQFRVASNDRPPPPKKKHSLFCQYNYCYYNYYY